MVLIFLGSQGKTAITSFWQLSDADRGATNVPRLARGTVTTPGLAVS